MKALRSLPLVSFTDRQQLPRRSGVYFIFSGGLLIYVGETSQIWQRCGAFSHEIYRRVRDRNNIQIGFIVAKDGEKRARLERTAIFRHRPIFNLRIVNPNRKNGGKSSRRKGR